MIIFCSRKGAFGPLFGQVLVFFIDELLVIFPKTSDGRMRHIFVVVRECLGRRWASFWSSSSTT